MTAIKRRRTRSTVIAFVAALVGVAAAVLLGYSGVRSLSESTAGRQAEGAADVVATQRLPFTSTALVGVVDEDARLTTAAVMVLEPNGVGGSIVVLAASADASSGTLDVLAPLAAVLEQDGPDEFLIAAERLTGLTFDVVQVLDQRGFAQMVAPLGDIPVLFPAPFRDASSGESWEAGDTVLSSPAMARAITATDPAVHDWAFEASRAAIWEAVAQRVGAGIGSASAVASDEDLSVPRALGEFTARLFAAPVQHRAIAFVAVDDERVDEQLVSRYSGTFDSVDAVAAHLRSDLIMTFGAVAPGRLGAPFDAPVFRLVSPFSDADLEPIDATSADVLQLAIDRLLFVQANVIAVADLPSADVPEVTQVFVADPEVTGAVRDNYEDVFGEIEVVPTKVQIEGIDIEVILGRNFLDEVAAVAAVDGDSPSEVAGSEGDDTTDDG